MTEEFTTMTLGQARENLINLHSIRDDEQKKLVELRNEFTDLQNRLLAKKDQVKGLEGRIKKVETFIDKFKPDENRRYKAFYDAARTTLTQQAFDHVYAEAKLMQENS